MSEQEIDELIHAEVLESLEPVFEMQKPPKETVLEEALRLTNGDRMETNGNPNANFERIAGMWNILFGGKSNGPFKSSDVAMAMVCLELSRQSHKPQRDNWTDIAGYSHCGNQCDEAEAK